MGKKKGGAGAPAQIDPQARAALESAEKAAEAGSGPQAPEVDTTAGPEAAAEPVQMYDAGGKPVDMPQADVGRAVASGQYGFAKNQTVHVKDESGRIYELAGAEVPQALQQGYSLASKAETTAAQERKEFSGFAKGAEALAAGFGRGLSFGGTDVLASAIGGEKARRELSKLKEHRPYLSATGEIGGALTPILVSGGAAAPVEGAELGAEGAGLAARTIGAVGAAPRAVARLGTAASDLASGVVGRGATSFLGRVAQKAIPMAVQGATEMPFYTVGQEISESALGNHELNAEKLIAAAKHGLFLGATGGAILGAGEVAAKALANKAFQIAGQQGLQDWLESFAAERRIKATGASQRDISRLGRTGEEARERMKSISDTLRDYRFENGEKLFRGTATTEELAQNTRRALDEQTAKLDSARKQVAHIIDADPALHPDVNGFFKQMDEQVLADLRNSNVTSIRNRAAKIEDELAQLRARAAPPALPEGHPLTGLFEQAQAGNERAQTAIDALAAKDPNFAAMVKKPPVTIEELTQTRKHLDDVIFPKTNSGVPPPAPEHQAQLLQIRGLLEKSIEDATEKAAQQVGKPELYQTLVAAKQKIHDLIPANQMAERWIVRDIGNRALSPTDYLTGGIAGHAIAGLGHGILGGGIGGLATAAAHHYLRERGSAMLAAAADKLAQLSAVRRATMAIDSKIESGIDTFLSRRAAPRSLAAASAYLSNRGQSRDKVYDTRRADIQRLTQNPSMLAERAAQAVGPIAQYAPQTAAAVASKAATATQNLMAKFPKAQPRPGSLMPTLDERRVARSDMAKAARYAAAVNDPLSIFDDMRANRLSREAVQALKDNSPELLKEIQGKVMDRISDRKEKIPYEKRVQLGVLFGVPTDPSLEPEFMQAIQGMYAQMGQQKKQGGQPVQGAKRPMKIASQSRTTIAALTAPDSAA